MNPATNVTSTVRRVITSETGSALAELAIVVPMLLLLLIGLMEVGRFGSYAILAGNAARAGVQYGAQNMVTAADNAGMQSRALADAQSMPGLTAAASHSCRCADGSASTCLPTDCSGSHRIVFVQVTTSGTVPSVLHSAYLPAALSSIAVGATATMRVSP